MPTFTTADGCALHRHDWAPESAARGLVLIVHGLGEHGGRYAHVAAALNRAGWRVQAFDLRGHGHSAGARGAVPDGDTLMADIAAALDAAPHDDLPRVLLGHSMGGLLAARFAAEALQSSPAAWSRPLDALVLSSPALDLGMNAGQKLLLALLGPLAPNLALGNGLKPAWVSRDPAVVRAYVDDPLVHDRITPRLVRLMLDSGAVVQRLAPQWAVPTLLMWAGADRCVAPAGSAAFAQAAPADRVTAHCWDDLFHEIFNEPQRDEVLAHLVGWLESLDFGARPASA